MDEDEMVQWEEKMAAGERRILMTQLLSKAADHAISPEQDEMRVGCFKRA